MDWDQQIFVDNVIKLLNGRPQNDLNKIAGRDAVTRWKKGDRPLLEVLLKVSNYFKCTLNDLLSTTLTDSRYYPYNDHNRKIHDDVEIILTCGDNSIINSFIMLLKGVMLTVKEGSEQVKLLRKIANGQEALLDVVKSFPGGGAGDEDASHASPKIIKHL